jgi:cysteine desulfurase / selenocysteine lyase
MVVDDREATVEDYRALFPITERFAYLDHAAMGPLSRPVFEAQRQFLEAQATLASEASPRFRQAREQLRQSMAAFIGADADEIALTKNTPEGLSIVASGLSWRPGDNIVTTDLEFPANMYPWLNLREAGVEVRTVASENGRIPAERLLSAVDGRTRLVAISYVQFSNGFRSDLARLSEFCRPRGVYLVTDAIQAVGALPVDVAALGVDFLACASHKWLLGPFGMGWFYCRRELLERLRPSEVGQGSMVERSSFLDYQFEFAPGAARFECGVVNMGGVYGLQASLDLLSSVGQAQIEEQILSLNARLADGLETRGYQVVSSRRGGEQSGILSFRSEQRDSSDLRERLHRAGVIVSLREGLVRVSPHFYNSADDLDRLLAALP